jgi:hypothetical protein
MARAEKTVEELVTMIEKGELRLPEMQRRYVWRSTRVRDLLDSLYRGYPSGAILLWETDTEVPLQEMAVSQENASIRSTNLLLLDGQQRLTSLSAVIRGEPVNVRGRRRPIEILFNLEHPDELQVVTEVEEDEDDDDVPADQEDASESEIDQRLSQLAFVVSTRKLERDPRWVKVTDVFKSDNLLPFLKRAGITDYDDPKGEKYLKRLERLRGIKKYIYRMDVLERSMSYDEVTEIFVRVNSLGAKLRSSDLALAQITATWKNSLAKFSEFRNECEKDGFDFDLGVYLRMLVIVATGQSRFRTIGDLDIGTLQDSWDQARKALDFAFNFLRSNVGIDSATLLSSPFLVLVLGYLGTIRNFKIDNSEARALRHWALIANAKGRHSRGSTETVLDQDLAVIKSGGGVEELFEKLRTQVGRLDITVDELQGKNVRSSLFKTMFLAFRAAGAKDWGSNLNISLHHRGGQHRLQGHHFFPKKILNEAGIPDRTINDISNLTFIGGETNRKISAKRPCDYVPEYLKTAGAAPFEAQCIPIEDDLLKTESFARFLEKRRALIAERLNEFINGEK